VNHDWYKKEMNDAYPETDLSQVRQRMTTHTLTMMKKLKRSLKVDALLVVTHYHNIMELMDAYGCEKKHARG
jgi:hypothetical protein